MEIKFTLIACAVVAIASALLTYNYTSNHYEAVIAKDKTEQVIAAQETTKLVVAKERKNAETTQALNAKALEQSKTIASQQNELRSYRTSSGGLLVKSDSCEASVRVANSTTGSNSASTPTTPEGICQLQPGFGELLSKTFSDADSMRGNLLICQEYAKAIDKQRKEMYNSKD